MQDFAFYLILPENWLAHAFQDVFNVQKDS